MTSFGVHLRGPDPDPQAFGELCGKVEEWGFDSVWLADGLTRGMLDPLAALSYAAASTSRVKLGTCIYVVPVRHPLVTAKLTASLDRLSDGRFILGVGVGWREDEFTATGVPFERRGEVADECLNIIIQAWTNGTVDHQGSFYKISGIKMSLQPAQRPRPQVWVGGNGKPAALRAAKFGDYWIPTDYSVEEYKKGRVLLSEASTQANRSGDLPKLASHLLVIIDKDRHVAHELAKNVASSLNEKFEDLREWAIVGDPDEVKRRIDEYNSLGVDYHVLNFATKVRDEERIKLFADTVLRSF